MEKPTFLDYVNVDGQGMDWKMDSQTYQLNFIERFTLPMYTYFCRHKSDNNTKVASLATMPPKLGKNDFT